MTARRPVQAVTCCIRYQIDPAQIGAFERYAGMWMALVERHGGHHHGYFLPTESPASQQFSFPGVGKAGPADMAIALFTFASEEAYQAYRQSVAKDPDCRRAEEIFRESHCFLQYERNFLRKLEAE